MMNLIKKLFNKRNATTVLKVTYKFDGEICVDFATSCGLASLDCDPYVEIISVEKL